MIQGMPVLLKDLDDIPAHVDVMFREAELDSFDLGKDWYKLLFRAALPPEARPVLVLQDGEGDSACLLPLLLGGHRLTALSTYYTSLFRPLLGKACKAPDLARAFSCALVGQQVSQVLLRPLDATNPGFQLLKKALLMNGYWPFEFFAFGNWYLPTVGKTYAQYEAGLPPKTRNTLRRKTRKFLADRRGRLEMVTGGEGLEKSITDWVHIYNTSWKKPEPFPEFVPGLIRLCAEKGWLRLGVAYHDGVPIAAQIWIVNGGRAAIYKLAYDEAHAHFSAGTILTGYLMQQVLDVDRVSEVDYLIGDDPYKKEWMTHRRERFGIVAYNLRSIEGWGGLLKELAGRVWRRASGHGGKHSTQ
jgi:hypothetical protein